MVSFADVVDDPGLGDELDQPDWLCRCSWWAGSGRCVYNTRLLFSWLRYWLTVVAPPDSGY